MKENISFEFIKSDKTEPNIYYRIPKILFESSVFEDLSTDAKYLYSFMLDRVSLSSKNKWIDPDGRVYIIYTVKQVCEILKCGKDNHDMGSGNFTDEPDVSDKGQENEELLPWMR